MKKILNKIFRRENEDQRQERLLSLRESILSKVEAALKIGVIKNSRFAYLNGKHDGASSALFVWRTNDSLVVSFTQNGRRREVFQTQLLYLSNDLYGYSYFKCPYGPGFNYPPEDLEQYLSAIEYEVKSFRLYH